MSWIFMGGCQKFGIQRILLLRDAPYYSCYKLDMEALKKTGIEAKKQIPQLGEWRLQFSP